MSIVSDVPKGTGLGSSSVLAVCLCKLAGVFRFVPEAMLLEQSVSPSVGLQDSLPAVYGGFRIYRLGQGPFGFPVESAERVPQSAIDIINSWGMLLYTGITREANAVLGSWHTSVETLHRIKELAEKMAACVNEWTPALLGNALAETWQLKRSVEGVSNEVLERQYAEIMNAGAYGAKVCGAGAGGTWFLIVPPSKRRDVAEASGMKEIPFRVVERGVEEWLL